MCQGKLFYLFFCQHNGLFLQLRRCDFSKINRKIKTVLQAKTAGYPLQNAPMHTPHAKLELPDANSEPVENIVCVYYRFLFFFLSF